MRKKIVAGNWKMNTTPEKGLELASEVINMIADEVQSDTVVVLCPPFTHLLSVGKLLAGRKNIYLGAQNAAAKPSGAFTGEISPEMLVASGVTYVILGHSERREYFGETNETLKAKTDLALQTGLSPIFCCGETREMRENGDYVAHVSNQLTESLFHLSAEDFGKLVIAYEPIWAIGTGLTASTEQAQDMHAALRAHIAGKYGSEVADNVSILYGGSANPKNAKELFSCPDVDGGLIGGASLKSRDFTDVVKAA
ncbi:MAG: triose-phosphate isomerase [Bacteroidota bacterium]